MNKKAIENVVLVIVLAFTIVAMGLALYTLQPSGSPTGFVPLDFELSNSNGPVCDNCPNTANAGQEDGDMDLVGDACDNCPEDFNPRKCHFDGVPTEDTCVTPDDCPMSPGFQILTVTTCEQVDTDDDGLGNVCDNCHEVQNPEQEDTDQNCPELPFSESEDPLCGDACQEQPICGNGMIESPEECDDGNLIPGDGCSNTCMTEFCGDGITQSGLGETCDDGNSNNDDGCSSDCQLEFCGDGIQQANEQCDDNNNNAGDGCSPICTIEECGNGFVDPPEGCDDGGECNDNSAPCTTNDLSACSEPGEATCVPQDDDGCDANCMPEVPETCGDGNLDEPEEECDDGNLFPGDGCSPFCTVEGCGNGIHRHH